MSTSSTGHFTDDDDDNNDTTCHYSCCTSLCSSLRPTTSDPVSSLPKFQKEAKTDCKQQVSTAVMMMNTEDKI